jgi:hypothetical protein
MPADEISIHEMSDGQGAFVADMRINLWQKRMRVSGRVSVEFIARGMIPPFVSLLDCSRLTRSLQAGYGLSRFSRRRPPLAQRWGCGKSRFAC